jgi:hypothetical protein
LLIATGAAVMTTVDREKRDAAIRKAIEETLAPARIREVIVREDVDHDGDPIYRITIILASENENTKTKKALNLWDAVMKAAQQFDDEWRFPIFTFMTPSEAEEVGDAAA